MRPDQRVQHPVPYPVTSRSGSSETQATGVPALVPMLSSAQVTGAGAQPPTAFFTYSAPGKLWGAHLSFAADTNASYASGSQRLYAQAKLSSGLVICTIELCLSTANQAANGDGDPFFGGAPVAQGTQILLDVNNNTIIGGGNGILSASVVVFYSIP